MQVDYREKNEKRYFIHSILLVVTLDFVQHERLVVALGTIRLLQGVFVKIVVENTKVTFVVPKTEETDLDFIRDLRSFIEEEVPGPVSAPFEKIGKIEEKNLVITLQEMVLIII